MLEQDRVETNQIVIGKEKAGLILCMGRGVLWESKKCWAAWSAKDGQVPGTPRKMSASVIFGTFLKISVVRFLELIAKIGIAKIGIAKIGITKIGIPIGMDR